MPDAIFADPKLAKIYDLLDDPERLDLAPNLAIEAPSAATDAPLLLEWRHTTFLDYLRIALQLGGFPGLARCPRPPELEALRGDLMPL